MESFAILWADAPQNKRWPHLHGRTCYTHLYIYTSLSRIWPAPSQLFDPDITYQNIYLHSHASSRHLIVCPGSSPGLLSGNLGGSSVGGLSARQAPAVVVAVCRRGFESCLYPHDSTYLLYMHTTTSIIRQKQLYYIYICINIHTGRWEMCVLLGVGSKIRAQKIWTGKKWIWHTGSFPNIGDGKVQLIGLVHGDKRSDCCFQKAWFCVWFWRSPLNGRFNEESPEMGEQNDLVWKLLWTNADVKSVIECYICMYIYIYIYLFKYN